MFNVPDEWKHVFEKDCDSLTRLVFADWLEERGYLTEAKGWRKFAEMRVHPYLSSDLTRLWYNGDYYSWNDWSGRYSFIPDMVLSRLSVKPVLTTRSFVKYPTSELAILDLIEALGTFEEV